MTDMSGLIQHSSLIWLMGAGLLLGALHALEPGHAKTMIASFVIATRGTVPQAVLLGLSAAASHSLLIWVLAAAALYFGNAYIGDDVEPWLQLASGIVIVGIGVAVTWRHQRALAAHHAPDGSGPQGGRLVDTGHGFLELAIFEDQVPPQFRLFFYDSAMRPTAPPAGEHVEVTTRRPDGAEERFVLAPAGLCLASPQPIAEPHEFDASLTVAHDDHAHDFAFAFREAAHHHHDDHHHHAHDHHAHEHEDAHARAHARQMRAQLGGGAVTMRQIALFGVSSGLMPCPAALTTLLVCLRLKQAVLGIGLVTSFSLGLAVTLVGLGVAASIGVSRASRHLPQFGWLADALPYVSGAAIIGAGVFMASFGAMKI